MPPHKQADKAWKEVEQSFDPSKVRRTRGGLHYHACPMCSDEVECRRMCVIDHDQTVDGRYFSDAKCCDQCDRDRKRFAAVMDNAACKNPDD